MGKVTLDRLTVNLERLKRQEELKKIHRKMFPECPTSKEESIKPVIV